MQRSEGLIGVVNDFGEQPSEGLTLEGAMRPKTDKYVDGIQSLLTNKFDFVYYFGRILWYYEVVALSLGNTNYN